MRRVFQIAVAAYLWTGLEVDGVTNNRIGRRDYCGVDEIGLCCEVYSSSTSLSWEIGIWLSHKVIFLINIILMDNIKQAIKLFNITTTVVGAALQNIKNSSKTRILP